MNVRKVTDKHKEYPEVFKSLPDPPRTLYVAGASLTDLLQSPLVAVVGSRKVTAYGRAVTEKLAGDLARQGIIIVSGLALGVDAVAHQAALAAGGRTIAVLPSSLDNVYPYSHQALARRIVEQGGALITEYPVGSDMPHKHYFIARNRLISGLSQGTLITEAAERSGSLHTANFALEQGREVMAVPGNITSPLSAGTNNLIKTGATPVTTAADVLQALKLEPLETSPLQLKLASEEERLLLELVTRGIHDPDMLLTGSNLPPALFNQTITLLELAGHLKPYGSGWTLA